MNRSSYNANHVGIRPYFFPQVADPYRFDTAHQPVALLNDKSALSSVPSGWNENNAQDDDVTYQGQPTIRFTASEDGRARGRLDFAALDLTDFEYIEVVYRVNDYSRVPATGSFALRLGNDNSNFFTTAAGDLSGRVPATPETEWHRFRINSADMVKGGAPTWNGITYVTVDVNAPLQPPSEPLIMHVARLDAYSVDKGKVCIHFDDGYLNTYTKAFPILQAHGLVATCALVTSYMDTNPIFMGWDQAREMAAAGWSMVSHTHGELYVDSTTEGEFVPDLLTSQRVLREQRLAEGARLFVAGGGQWNTTWARSTARKHLSAARTGGGKPSWNPIPANDPHDLRWFAVSVTDPPATVEEWVDEVIANKRFAHLTWHNVGDLPNEYTEADLDAVMAYIALKRDEGVLDVLSMGDYVFGG